MRTSLVMGLVAVMGLLGCNSGSSASRSDRCTTWCQRQNTACSHSDDCGVTCGLLLGTGGATSCNAQIDAVLACYERATDSALCSSTTCQSEVASASACTGGAFDASGGDAGL